MRKLPNSNIAISESIIVTKNVHNRLKWQAQEIVPLSKKYIRAEKWSLICLAFPMLFLLLLHLSDIKIHSLLVVALLLAGQAAYYFLNRISKAELDKRMTDVNSSLNQLADERQKKIAEMKRFYQSAEWRLLRSKIIREKGNVCCDCKRTIKDPNDITVDHILPRSKYAKHVLDEANMQILCRSCNSKKGSSVPLADANV